jgi:hypothetical protein
MVKKNRIPNEVLKNIFPKKLIGRQAQMKLYTQLKEMILSGDGSKAINYLMKILFKNLMLAEDLFTLHFLSLRRTD